MLHVILLLIRNITRYSNCKRYSGESISCLFTYTNSPGCSENVDIGQRTKRVAPIDPPKEQEEKTIPLVNLGSRVLEQAETEVKTVIPLFLSQCQLPKLLHVLLYKKLK